MSLVCSLNNVQFILDVEATRRMGRGKSWRPFLDSVKCDLNEKGVELNDEAQNL